MMSLFHIQMNLVELSITAASDTSTKLTRHVDDLAIKVKKIAGNVCNMAVIALKRLNSIFSKPSELCTSQE